MANTRTRDDGQLLSGLGAWLADRHPDGLVPTLEDVHRPSAGLSNETLVVTARWAAGGRERLVVRLPPLEPSFPELDLAVQATVQNAVRAAGIPAPLVTHEPDTRWIGTPFLLMPFVEGRIPGQAPAFDDWIVRAAPARQLAMCDALIDVIADIHRLDWQACGLGRVLRGVDRSLEDEVAWWQGYLGWAAEDGAPLPDLQSGLDWCHAHCPARQPAPSLLWGDARLGNLVYDDAARIVGVLDWETASIGPAEMDLAWYLALNDLQVQLSGRAVPGFRDRAGLIARYQQRLGRPLVDLPWHEVFALVRALAISNRQARVALRHGVGGLPADASHPLVPAIERAIGAAER